VRTSPIISFGTNALEIKQDGTYSCIFDLADGLQPFADLDDLKNGNISAPYATYEPDFWLLDGNYKFMPSVNVFSGLISLEMTNASSVFAGDESVILESVFSKEFSTSGRTLTFSEATGDYVDS